jgi:hypothetical protein
MNGVGGGVSYSSAYARATALANGGNAMKVWWSTLAAIAAVVTATTVSMSFGQLDENALPAAPTISAPRWDCVYNGTNKVLTVSVTTNYRATWTYLHPGKSFHFYYYVWNRKAMLVAYEYGKDNLIHHREFTLMDQEGKERPDCLQITPETTVEGELPREASREGTHAEPH